MFVKPKRPAATPEVVARAEAKVAAAKVTIASDKQWRFFRPLFMSLKTFADIKCKTAWTDAVSIGYSPVFIDELDHDEVVGTMLHETMHPALGHNWRMKGFGDRKLANIAADKIINTQLAAQGVKLPEGAHYCEQDELGMSFEQLYYRLLDKQEQEKEQPQPDNPQPGDDEDDKQDGDDTGDGDGPEGDEDSEPEDGDEDGEGEGDSDQPGDDEGDEEGDGDGDGTGDGDDEDEGEGDGQGDEEGDEEGDDDEGDCRDAPEGADEDGNEASEADWKHRVTQAVALGKGSMTGGLQRLAEDAVRPRLDVRALLIQFLQERSKNDYSWTRPNARYASQGLYLPALHDNQLGEVAIMVDTSASMSRHDLAKARGIIEDVINECRPKALSVWYADANVARVDRFDEGEPLVWQPAGFGGTDFRPAFKQMNEEGTAVCVIAISDLDGDFPEVEPDIPTVWLSTVLRDWRTGQNVTAPFGETYYIND